MATRVNDVVRELKAGSLDRSSNARLKETRLKIVRGWLATRDLLAADGNHQLADQVSRFVRQMPPPRTEKQWLAAEVIERARAGKVNFRSREPHVGGPGRKNDERTR